MSKLNFPRLIQKFLSAREIILKRYMQEICTKEMAFPCSRSSNMLPRFQARTMMHTFMIYQGPLKFTFNFVLNIGGVYILTHQKQLVFITLPKFSFFKGLSHLVRKKIARFLDTTVIKSIIKEIYRSFFNHSSIEGNHLHENMSQIFIL